MYKHILVWFKIMNFSGGGDGGGDDSSSVEHCCHKYLVMTYLSYSNAPH